METDVEATITEVRSVTRELDSPSDLTALVERLSDTQYVLLGEASHGTSEYYRWRSWLSAQLIQKHDFSFVAVEGDWTDCYEVNRYVKGLDDEMTACEVLSAFERWPTWMWANWEVLEFLEWLASYNEGRTEGEMAGFYGLDVYSLFESMRALIKYLDDIDPDAAADARDAYRCFEPYGEDAREYARAVRLAPESCEDEVVEVLAEFIEDGPDYSDNHPDERFSAEQNALIAKNAEEYYRAMIGGGTDSWNIRDRHMTETLERLMEHHGSDARGIIWAHNTHIGDARATDMKRHGRHNIGQLVREQAETDNVMLIGYGSHRGSVIAGEEWEASMEQMTLPPAQRGSYEDIFHRAGHQDRLLLMDELQDESRLDEERGHRAIGVVYDPDHEANNYVPTVLPERYDAFIYLDETEALHPLAMHTERNAIPELYPWGL